MTMDFEKVRRGEWRTIDKKYKIVAVRSKWQILENTFGDGEYLESDLFFDTLIAAKYYIINRHY